MNQPTIILDNVSVQQQGKNVLEGISFQLLPQQHLLISGPSGSGKTILAKALAGQVFIKGNLTYQFAGDNHTILLVGQRNEFKNLSNVTDFYYQQRFNSTDNEDALTVEQILLQEHDDAKATEALLQQLGLHHRKQAPLIQLSSGEHKRLQLIKALLQKPRLLILDNPFTGLDIASRKQLQQIINTIAANGTQVILIAHAADAPYCITHVLDLREGKIDLFDEISNTTIEQFNHPSFQPVYIPVPISEQHHHFDYAVKMLNVHIQYGEKIILENVSWHVRRGECWLVKGHNGAGKSTLLSLITGDNPQAYANEIYLFDKRRGSGESIWDIKKQIGFASAELHWYFDKNTTCRQAIASGLFDTMGLYRQLSEKQQDTVNSWTNFFSLEDVQHQSLASLPAGRQRLVLLARALVKSPALLILDEPCQGLDPEQTQQFIQLIDTICEQTNTTLIYVSHYEEEVPFCINRVLELTHGQHATYQRQ
ncbi:ABC transporter [Russula earlei]|uniref:ABC transporter n=1 Tax=Russula earlei TaxID=71964 RepID=A0ACC0TRJ3_9AGAM|nr:ABC transporter [Russula earlei]